MSEDKLLTMNGSSKHKSIRRLRSWERDWVDWCAHTNTERWTTSWYWWHTGYHQYSPGPLGSCSWNVLPLDSCLTLSPLSLSSRPPRSLLSLSLLPLSRDLSLLLSRDLSLLLSLSPSLGLLFALSRSISSFKSPRPLLCGSGPWILISYHSASQTAITILIIPRLPRPYSSPLSFLLIGFRCMKLQKPDLVHSPVSYCLQIGLISKEKKKGKLNH